MSVSCHVEIDGAPDEPRKPYTFAQLPRVGEWVSLFWDQDRGNFPRFTVRAIRHIPDGAEELAAYTVLYVAEGSH